jgi:hypothetical protein
MKPSLIIFVPVAAMSVCSVAALYAGLFFLSAAATVLAGLGYWLVLALEEIGK